jgi:hypothetical protein
LEERQPQERKILRGTRTRRAEGRQERKRKRKRKRKIRARRSGTEAHRRCRYGGRAKLGNWWGR